MSAGSCFMEKTSNVRTWSDDGEDKDGQKITEYGSYKSTLTVNSEPLIVNSSSKNDSDERKMRAENDEKWCHHETQLHFVQQEHSLMLNKLHLEIENLQIKHARFDLNLCTCGLQNDSELRNLRFTLKTMKQELKAASNLNESKGIRICALEKRIKELEVCLKDAEKIKKQFADRKSCPAEIKLKPIIDGKPKLTDAKLKVANNQPKLADVKPKIVEIQPKLVEVKPKLAAVKPNSTFEKSNSTCAISKTVAVKSIPTTETRNVTPKPSPPVTKIVSSKRLPSSLVTKVVPIKPLPSLKVKTTTTATPSIVAPMSIVAVTSLSSSSIVQPPLMPISGIRSFQISDKSSAFQIPSKKS